VVVDVSTVTWLQFFLWVVQGLRLLVGRGGAKLHVMDQTRNPLMKTSNFVALAVGVLLTAAQFWAIYYDARHGISHYHGEVATALPAHR
jgi:fumarate reductase subunit C